VPRQKRRAHLQKNSGLRHNCEDNLEDTYRSLMRSTHNIEEEADDDTSSDRTDSDASSNDEEWNEETTLFEMLSSPYWKSFPLCVRIFAHLRV
jgi:hypothetical protein